MNQPNPFQAVGLPPTFVPTPIGWTFAKVDANGPTGPTSLHLLIIDSAIGRVGFTLDNDSLRRLGEQMFEQASGLTIATDVPPNGHRKHPGFSGRS